MDIQMLSAIGPRFDLEVDRMLAALMGEDDYPAALGLIAIAFIRAAVRHPEWAAAIAACSKTAESDAVSDGIVARCSVEKRV